MINSYTGKRSRSSGMHRSKSETTTYYSHLKERTRTRSRIFVDKALGFTVMSFGQSRLGMLNK